MYTGLSQSSTNLIDDAQQVLCHLLAIQKCERKEFEGQIAEQACYLDDSKASYQKLTDDLQRSKIITKNAEGIIASAQAMIAKAQALIQDKEQKLVTEKKKVEEFEVAKSRVQQKLNVHTSKLEDLQAQLTAKKHLLDAELRVQALAKVEEACQRDIQRPKDQIKSLAERD